MTKALKYVARQDLDVQSWAQLKKHPIMNGIQEAEIEKILSFFRKRVLHESEFLIQEGVDATMELFLVITGSLEVMKRASGMRDDAIPEERGRFTLASLSAGEMVGELSFLKGGPRSASIRSMATSTLLSLTPEDLLKLELQYPASAVRIMKNMLIYLSERISTTSANEVNALKIDLQNSFANSRAILFFSYVIGILCVYNLAIHTITTLSLNPSYTSIISSGVVLLFCGVLVLMISRTKLPLRIFGMTTLRWRPALKEALLWSAIAVVVLVFVKWSLIHAIPKYNHLPLFSFNLAQKYLLLNFILYGLHSPIQEFIARGVLQGSLQHFLSGRNIKLRAIIISNALFAATHVHLMSGWLGLFVFIPGLLWGWLYARNQNLLGVIVSHMIIGWMALFFLDIGGLFSL